MVPIFIALPPWILLLIARRLLCARRRLRRCRCLALAHNKC